MNTGDETDLDAERKVTELKLPEFRAHIKGEDLDGLEERDRRLLLALSIVEQKLDFVVMGLQEHNSHIRYVELEMIRQRRWQRNMGWKMSAVLATALTIGTGLVGELCRVGFKQMFP